MVSELRSNAKKHNTVFQIRYGTLTQLLPTPMEEQSCLVVVEHMEEQDKSKRFEIVGVEDADKIRKDLWNIINSKEKVNVNLLRDEDVQTIDVDGKSIVVINVSRAEATMRPIYINNNLSRGTFKRNH